MKISIPALIAWQLNMNVNQAILSPLLNDNICPICIETFADRKVSVSQCLHRFHDDCILHCLRVQVSDQCPVCRRNVKPLEDESSLLSNPIYSSDNDLLIKACSSRPNLVSAALKDRPGIIRQRFYMRYNDNDGSSSCEYITLLFAATLSQNLRLTTDLINAGSSVNAECSDGSTPLHFAVIEGYHEIVDYLIQAGANLNLQRYCDKMTPLDLAIDIQDTKMIFKLIEAGANPSSLQRHSSSILVKALDHIDLLSYMINNLKVEVEHKWNNDYTLLHIAVIDNLKDGAHLLIRAGANVNALTKDGQTPISIACSEGHIEFAANLLCATANIEIADNQGMTPMDYAIKYGYWKIVTMLKQFQELGPVIKSSRTLPGST